MSEHTETTIQTKRTRAEQQRQEHIQQPEGENVIQAAALEKAGHRGVHLPRDESLKEAERWEQEVAAMMQREEAAREQEFQKKMIAAERELAAIPDSGGFQLSEERYQELLQSRKGQEYKQSVCGREEQKQFLQRYREELEGVLAALEAEKDPEKKRTFCHSSRVTRFLGIGYPLYTQVDRTIHNLEQKIYQSAARATEQAKRQQIERLKSDLSRALSAAGGETAKIISLVSDFCSQIKKKQPYELIGDTDAKQDLTDFALAELAGRLEINPANIKMLLEASDYYVQDQGLKLASRLSADELAELLCFWQKNYWQLVDRAFQSFNNDISWDYVDTGGQPHYFFAKDIFQFLGEAINQKISRENRERFETLYLELLKSHILDGYFDDRHSSDMFSEGPKEIIGDISKVEWDDFLAALKEEASGALVSFQQDGKWQARAQAGTGAAEEEWDEAGELNPLLYEDQAAEFWERNLSFEDERLLAVNVALKQLRGFGGKKTVDFLSTWLKWAPRANASLVGETLSAIDAQAGVRELLPLLKDKDENVSKAAARALYRIELGRIGISEQGVKYLEKIYDLGEHNDPNYFVQRLTASGDIGIFNEARTLFRYFNLGDLSSKEEAVKAQVLSFVYETLFIPKADETPVDRAEREEILEEFQKHYFNFYKDKFFNRADLRFNNLSFREQGMFLHFSEQSDDARKERVSAATARFGREWFHSFLALDWGSEYGERLLAVAERYPHNLADDFFREYSRLNFAAQDLSKEIAPVFGAEESEFIIQFQEALMRRMKDIINVAYQLADSGKAVAPFYSRELGTKDLAQPVEALRDARKMVELVKEFLSEAGAKSGRFKFLPPAVEEKVVAGTPEGISHVPGLWQCFRFAVEPMAGISKQRSHFMVQLRQYGAPVYNLPDGEIKSMHNQKIEFDGEARINFVWIPEPADAENVSLLVDNPERQAGISFRLDREGKVRTKEDNLIKEKNDPTRLAGELSLEMGGVRTPEQPAHNQNTRLGEIIAIGQYFSSQHDKFEAGKLPQYYHNRASFSAKYGQAGFFANLVEKMARAIEARYEPERRPPRAGES